MRTRKFLFLVCMLLASCTSAPLLPSPSPQVTPIPQASLTPAFIPCTQLYYPVTPEAALEAEFEDRAHIFGSKDAPVTIILFSDYNCLQCAFLAASLRQVRLAHPDDVRIVALHAPQADRPLDDSAILAAEAADLQGKFWEMNDLLFEKQAEWTGLTAVSFLAWSVARAGELGLDIAQFEADLSGLEVQDRLQRAVQFSTGAQPFTPPLLYVNSASPYTGLADFGSLDSVIRLDALVSRQFSTCPPHSVDANHQVLVTLETSKGLVTLQLYPDKAPLAVNNFVFLARSGWYDDITFYEVQPGMLVASGDPSETGLGNPGYLFGSEIATGLQFDQPGMLAMDNDGPGTNGSRFFITLAAMPELNGQYTIFGQVIRGLEVLSGLAPRLPQPGVALPPGDALLRVSVEER